MEHYFEEALNVIKELYGKDVTMSLATACGNKPNIRTVDVYYKEEAFYIVTYALSSKVKEITENPYAALNHNLFVAHGIAENIGHPLDRKNKAIREELRKVFSEWYDRHNNEQDENMCFLEITLSDALLFANNYQYKLDFLGRRAIREPFIIDMPM